MRLCILLLMLSLSNCVQINDSNLIGKDLLSKKKNQKMLSDMTNNVSYTTEMTFNEFKIYIDEYTKNSKYPNINQ
jgi:hypothetical protein